VALNALGTTTWPVNVSNVSSGATEATLREFFSFCGAVGDIVLAPSTDGATQEGTVQFMTEAGAETALVLDMALIVDRPISIRAAVVDHPLVPEQRDAAPVAEPLHEAPYAPPPPASMPTPPMQQQQPSMADYGSSAPVGTASAGASAPSADDPPDAAEYQYPRLAALLDAGYQLGRQAIDVMEDFETKHGYKKRAAEALAVLQAKVREVDEQHAISAKVIAFSEEHEIAERATAVWHSALTTGKAAVETAKPHLQAAVETAKPHLTATAESVQLAVESAKPHLAATAESVQLAVESAKPHLAATAEAVATKADTLKQRAIERLERPDVQQGLDNARQSLAGLSAWASASLFGRSP